MTKSAQILSAEHRMLIAGRAYGDARYAEVHDERQSAIATGRLLLASAELVHAAEALRQADEDTRNRRTLDGLRELRDATTYTPTPTFEGEAP